MKTPPETPTRMLLPSPWLAIVSCIFYVAPRLEKLSLTIGVHYHM